MRPGDDGCHRLSKARRTFVSPADARDRFEANQAYSRVVRQRPIANQTVQSPDSRVELEPTSALEPNCDGEASWRISRPVVSDHGPPPLHPTWLWPKPDRSRSPGLRGTIS